MITKNLLILSGKEIMKIINKKKNTRKKISLVIILFLFLLIFLNVLSKDIEVNALSKYGSTGNEVRQIQTKLKQWGYYNGNVDGVFGSKTLDAVKYFQSKNGLTVDGIAGTKTLNAMGIANTTSSSSSNNSSNLNLMAHLIYAEARGEPYTGQVAIGGVVLNRVKSSQFPNTIAGVIYQSGAFTPVQNGQINLEPDTNARKAAQDALNGWDPSYGSLYYFNPATATNKWIWSRPHVITIGKHRFCK